MTARKTPCKGCENRHLYCHALCEKYKEWKQEKAKERSYTREKKEETRISRNDFDKEFWL